MKHRPLNVTVMLLSLLALSGARAGDCFNDDVPASNDLEPPPPGSSADLLRITDGDVDRVLREIAAYERKRRVEAAASDAVKTQ